MRSVLCVSGLLGILFLTGCTSKPAVPPAIVAKPTVNQPAPAQPATPAPTTPEPAANAPSLVPDDEKFAITAAPRDDAFATGSVVPARDNDFVATRPASGVDSASFVVVSKPASPADAVAAGTPFSALPAGFVAVESSGKTSDGWPFRINCEKDGSVMVLIPGGVFLSGASGLGSAVEPEHGVYLDPFYIDVYEVSSEQYDAYRESAKQAKRIVQAPVRHASDPHEPVTGINWGEANLYTRYVGKELPTEAQWEKAARGISGFRYPWGNETHLWERPRKVGQIHVAGLYSSDFSPFGLFDMAGNAREWCADYFADTAYKQRLAQGESVVRNPAGPKSSPSGLRVVRGGEADWNVIGRTALSANERPLDVGFRCVLSLRVDAEKSPKTPPATGGNAPAPKTSPTKPAPKPATKPVTKK